MSSPQHRAKELNFEIQEAYEELGSSIKVAERIGMSESFVSRRLRQWGISKPRGYIRLHCVECEKPTHGAMRCALHARIRSAALTLERQRRYKARKAVDTDGMVKSIVAPITRSALPVEP